VFWKAMRQAYGEAEAALSAPHATAFIPDLVPVSRARRSIDPGESSGPRFDFDDANTAGPSLDLDLPPDEPRYRRSLTPPNPSLAPIVPEPPVALDVPARTTGPVSAAPRASQPIPSLAPIGTGPRTPSVPPTFSLEPRSGERAGTGLPAPMAMPRASVPSAPPTLTRRLAPGVAMAAASVLLTLLDHVYASFSGEVFSIGPLRTTWIAALLLLGGIGLVAMRLVELRQH
jgi:hypothetical protein